jgi:mannose-1-phosphate guanylyltransferase/mannose-6-phosphate isomerase
MTTLYPVILSGGSGSRLWPLSREAYPKQLLALLTAQTMLQETVMRAMRLGSAGLQVASPIIICNEEHRFLIREQCQAIGHDASAIYLEPAGRNTAPAIALAAFHLAHGEPVNPDALMLVLPADHVIQNASAFFKAVTQAARAAQQGHLVTFGITPDYPETGYGYIKSGAALPGLEGVAAVAQFVEKPPLVAAREYVNAGTYSWNSGMFLFRAGTYLQELGTHKPDILNAIKTAWQHRTTDLGFYRPEKEAFLKSPSDSIDYAVMQPTKRAAVVPADIGWNDVGSWDALWKLSAHDADGNARQGDVMTFSTRNSYLRAESKLLAVIGMDDVVVVETRDAVLVMPKSHAQDVKKIVEGLKKQGRSEAMHHTRCYRPWGWYEGIDADPGFQVKRLMVKPGEKLSLQMHHHRAEHWVVVQGEAKVTIGTDVRLLKVNEAAYIPFEAVHRLENPGTIPLYLVEVQSGSYLGEDDIVRFNDDYGRGG